MSRRLILSLALILAASVLALAVYFTRPRTGTFEDAPVILISIDTLRADRLPLYGYKTTATPNIDALRRDGILYRNAYAHCPMTLPSHVSMLTGLLPTEHQVRNNLGYRFDAAKHETIAQVLARRGYATGAAVSSYVLRGETGLREAFDFYDDAIPVATEGASSQHQRPGRETLATAEKWISTHSSKPFLFMFHLYEPHAPYVPPEPFLSRYADKYDGEVAATDAIVGDFIAFLKQRGIYDRAVIILTSDHGEGLWQHGEDQHGILLYREVLQVPLIVKLPQSKRAGAAFDPAVALIDLFPTIAGLTKAEVPESLPGASLIDLLDTRDPPSRRIYSETFYPRIHLGWSELRSIIDGRHHYIAGPRSELYDVEKDPAETNDVVTSERRIAASMRQELERYPAGIEELSAVDPEDAAKLAALGYIGSVRSVEGNTPLPNPRDMLPWLERIKAAFKLSDERRYEDAVAALRQIVAENPGLTDAQDKLGELLVAMGRYDEAIRVYRDAMTRAERFSPEMALSLGNAYLRAGQAAEAARYAELALKTTPANAHALLARVAIAQRDFDRAEREARAAAGAENQQPSAMLLIAEVLRAKGDVEGALAQVEAAAQRAGELHVKTLYRLDFLKGDLLARRGDADGAIAAYRREIEHFPENIQAWANLSILYFINGDKRTVDQLLSDMVASNPHPGAYALAAHTLESFEDHAGAATWRRRSKEKFGV